MIHIGPCLSGWLVINSLEDILYIISFSWLLVIVDFSVDFFGILTSSDINQYPYQCF